MKPLGSALTLPFTQASSFPSMAQLMGFTIHLASLPVFPISPPVALLLCIVRWANESEGWASLGTCCVCGSSVIWQMSASYETGCRELIGGQVHNEVADAFLQGSPLTGLGKLVLPDLPC